MEIDTTYKIHMKLHLGLDWHIFHMTSFPSTFPLLFVQTGSLAIQQKEYLFTDTTRLEDMNFISSC